MWKYIFCARSEQFTINQLVPFNQHKKTAKNQDPHKFDLNANNWETGSWLFPPLSLTRYQVFSCTTFIAWNENTAMIKNSFELEPIPFQSNQKRVQLTSLQFHEFIIEKTTDKIFKNFFKNLKNGNW